ncbi:MAG: AMP-binding protein, partial [Pseudonocardiaceae bacterium]
CDPWWRGGAQERVLLHSPSAFDASTYEVWVPLLGGGQIVISPPGEMDIHSLEQVITQHDITSVFLTTALFNLMAEHSPSCCARMQQVWTGGEMVSPSAIQSILDACPQAIVVHVYGPTETTTFATCHVVQPRPDLAWHRHCDGRIVADASGGTPPHFRRICTLGEKSCSRSVLGEGKYETESTQTATQSDIHCAIRVVLF